VGGPPPPPTPHGGNRDRRTLQKHGPISRRRADSAGARRGAGVCNAGQPGSRRRASTEPRGRPRCCGRTLIRTAVGCGGGGQTPTAALPPPPGPCPCLGARAPAWATRADRRPSKPPRRAASWQRTLARHGSAAGRRAGPKSALVTDAPPPALQVQFEPRCRHRRRRGHRRCARRAAVVAGGPLGHPCRTRFLCYARPRGPASVACNLTRRPGRRAAARRAPPSPDLPRRYSRYHRWVGAGPTSIPA